MTPTTEELEALLAIIDAPPVRLPETYDADDLRRVEAYDDALSAAYDALDEHSEALAREVLAHRADHSELCDLIHAVRAHLLTGIRAARPSEQREDVPTEQLARVASSLLQSGAAREAAVEDLHRDALRLLADKNEALRTERDRLIADLAECYRLTGADCDGNEDWRIAPYAVREVARLRKEQEDLEEAHETLRARVAELECP